MLNCFRDGLRSLAVFGHCGRDGFVGVFDAALDSCFFGISKITNIGMGVFREILDGGNGVFLFFLFFLVFLWTPSTSPIYTCLILCPTAQPTKFFVIFLSLIDFFHKKPTFFNIFA